MKAAVIVFPGSNCDRDVQVALRQSMGAEPLMDKAGSNGIAALAINDAYHIAALWPELERVAERGFVTFAFTAAMAYVAPAGGTKALYGTNPMGFSWPRKGQPPLVFDQAASSMARGEIMIRARDGQAVPETAGITIQSDRDVHL